MWPSEVWVLPCRPVSVRDRVSWEEGLCAHREAEQGGSRGREEVLQGCFLESDPPGLTLNPGCRWKQMQVQVEGDGEEGTASPAELTSRWPLQDMLSHPLRDNTGQFPGPFPHCGGSLLG